MPSTLHEALVSLFRRSPRLAPMLAAQTRQIEIPEDLDIQVTSAEFADIDPPEYRADVVLRYYEDKKNEQSKIEDRERPTRDVFVIEVQLDSDASKQFRWPHYLPGNVFQPVVIGPRNIPVITDEAEAVRWPELAILSVIAHGHEPGSEHIGVAAYAACARLDNPQSSLYADLIEFSLSAVARVALEAIMEKHNYTYRSDFARRHFADGREDGYRGALRELIQQRFGELPDDANARLEQADADTLSTWLRRVLTAGDLADVFAPA